MSWANFWANFWPNLAATVLGIALGLPAAWWLENRLQRKSKTEHEVAGMRRTKEALGLARLAITENHSFIDKLRVAPVADDDVIVSPLLNANAWDALQTDLAHIPNPRLRYELAGYFGDVKSLLALIALYRDESLSLSAGGQSPLRVRTRQRMQNLIAIRANRLIERERNVLTAIAE